MTKFPHYILTAGFVMAVALLAGCKDNDRVQVYRVAKSPADSSAPENPGIGAMAPGAPIGAGDVQAPQITSEPPANWQPQPLSEMRQASYLVKDGNGATADISLVMLPGSAGGVLENVNRWMSQLNLPAITGEKLVQIGQHIASPLGDVTLVDLEGLPKGADPSKDGRIIGGISSEGGGTIFFKMRGNAALAESQKEAFINWIGSVRMADSGAGAPVSSGAAPVMPAPAPGAEQEKPGIKWEAPGEWKTIPASAMRYASFEVDGRDGAKADISVSVFDGDAGGDLPNVNRWRAQIGLPPVTGDDLNSLVVPVKARDAGISSVDMAGPKGRILAGWTQVDGQSWFFKLMGPDALAAQEKPAFTKFLQSVQFHP